MSSARGRDQRQSAVLTLFQDEGLVRSSRYNNGDATKLRGGYYTPAAIGSLLALWAVRSESALVLEPSCGDGQLIEAAIGRLGPDGRVIGIELFEEEAAKAEGRGGKAAEVIRGDFFSWFLAVKPRAGFDAVIGNPPFIRYQSFPEQHREAAFAIMRQEGLHPSRLTNAWLPFVVASTAALKRGGRLALVLPAELLQVTYAAELREYLARKYRRLIIVTFRQLVFSGLQQETILLFGVRDDVQAARIKWLELSGLNDLSDIERLAGANGVAIQLDHGREKWTQYYLSESELQLVRRIEKASLFPRLGELVDVDVGVVTGRNEFFVLGPSEAEARGLCGWCVPLVARSAQIPGLVFDESEWAQLRQSNSRCLLLNLSHPTRDRLPQKARAYVEEGESKGFHLEFKCRIRLPSWWHVPSVWRPDAFLLRQIHRGPRIIANFSKAACTDTIHRVRLKSDVSAEWLAAASLNSLTFAFAEIRGRSYGGGVLELEPSEAEALPFPRPGRSLPVQSLDGLVRRGLIEEAMDEVDQILLEPAGLTSEQIRALRGVWRKLYERRLSRKARGPGRTPTAVEKVESPGPGKDQA